MTEAGCAKDGHFQNLEVNGYAEVNNTTSLVRQKVVHIDSSNGAKRYFYLPPYCLIKSIDTVVVENITTNANATLTMDIGIDDDGTQLVNGASCAGASDGNGLITATTARPYRVYDMLTTNANHVGQLVAASVNGMNMSPTNHKRIHFKIASNGSTLTANHGLIAIIITYTQVA